MGMQRVLKMVKDYYGYSGSVCRRNAGINSSSNYGRASVTRGLVVQPCMRCVGVPYGAYQGSGGFTGCGKTTNLMRVQSHIIPVSVYVAALHVTAKFDAPVTTALLLFCLSLAQRYRRVMLQ
jgi:hypothetical protein